MSKPTNATVKPVPEPKRTVKVTTAPEGTVSKYKYPSVIVAPATNHGMVESFDVVSGAADWAAKKACADKRAYVVYQAILVLEPEDSAIQIKV